MKKLAREIYKLAWAVEHSATVKTADKWARFRDEEGHVFFIPYELTGKARFMHSPYTRRRAPRDGLFNVSTPPALEEAFGVTSGTKIAEKMVIFRCDDGRTFALPKDAVGTARFAWSPWDRSRAMRESLVNIPLSGKLEEAFELN